MTEFVWLLGNNLEVYGLKDQLHITQGNALGYRVTALMCYNPHIPDKQLKTQEGNYRMVLKGGNFLEPPYNNCLCLSSL